MKASAIAAMLCGVAMCNERAQVYQRALQRFGRLLAMQHVCVHLGAGDLGVWFRVHLCAVSCGQPLLPAYGVRDMAACTAGAQLHSYTGQHPQQQPDGSPPPTA
jgi:hypothetical protein